MKRLLLILLPCLAAAQQFNVDLVPASPGLRVGHTNQRWNGFFKNIDISGTCFINGVACGSGSGSPLGSVLLIPIGSQTIAQPGGSHFVITVGGTTLWDLSAASTLFNVPGSFNGGGLVNGINTPDSGSNCANGTNNTILWCSGVPGTNTLDPGGSFQPIFSAKDSGTVYTTALEALANKDQLSGYPSLTNLGQVPLAELIALAGQAGCNASNFVKGDFSGCASSSSSPNFSSIASGNNTTATMNCDTGCTLSQINSGVINANQVNTVVYPANSASPCGLGAADRVTLTTAAGTLCGKTIPQSTGSNFLQYDQSTHSFSTGAPAGSNAMIILPCTNAGTSCPNASEYVGDGNDMIMAQATISANTLTSGHCLHAIAWWTHSTGSGSVNYRWNFGGTGSVGTDVTGGTSTPNQSDVSAANYMESQIDVCNYNTNLVYARVHALQKGAAQLSGTIAQGISWVLSSNQTFNFIFNAPVTTDKVTFNGGYVNFP